MALEDKAAASPPSAKPVEKKILHAGKASSAPLPNFVDGTKVRFHFVTKQGDAVLDDSRTWDGHKNGPMELIFGKKFKLEVWELCLQTMAVGEVASFKVKKALTYNYPSVAKTLRDSFDPRRHKHSHGKGGGGGEKHQHQHMCGMMAMQMQGGLGYDDLNELMKEPSDLEFIIEVISIEQPEEYSKESWQMDADEKLGSIPTLREEGNVLFKEKREEEAATKYSQALGMLEQLMLREKPNDTEWLKLRDIKLPLLLNLSQCKLCCKEYYLVIEYCSDVLEADPDNVKALFRRAKAHMGAWNPKQAKNDFERVIELDSSLETACKKEIKKIEAMEKQKDEEDKKKFSKMF